MALYFVRHGETDYNKTLKIQGLIDNPLNEVGKAQALVAGEKLVGIEFEYIISSPLVRASETAKLINSRLNLEIVYNKNIVERDFGELEGCPVSSYYETKDFSVFKKYEQDEQIKKRVLNFLSTMDDKNYLIVTHSHFIKTLMLINNDNFTYASKLPNCAVVKLDNGKCELI